MTDAEIGGLKRGQFNRVMELMTQDLASMSELIDILKETSFQALILSKVCPLLDN
jgi:hypothetical protein